VAPGHFRCPEPIMAIRLAIGHCLGTASQLAPLPALARAPDLGSDSSLWANDGECDDPRFEGLVQSAAVNLSGSGHDENDCLQLCASGTASWCDYGSGTRDPHVAAKVQVRQASVTLRRLRCHTLAKCHR